MCYFLWWSRVFADCSGLYVSSIYSEKMVWFYLRFVLTFSSPSRLIVPWNAVYRMKHVHLLSMTCLDDVGGIRGSCWVYVLHYSPICILQFFELKTMRKQIDTESGISLRCTLFCCRDKLCCQSTLVSGCEYYTLTINHKYSVRVYFWDVFISSAINRLITDFDWDTLVHDV